MKVHQSKTLAAFTSLAVAFSVVVPSVSALTVPEAITSIQSSNPTLPTGVVNPKGNIWFLLANMFWNSSDFGYDSTKFGKIKPTFFDGAGATAWTYAGGNTYMTDMNGRVGIWTNDPQAYLHLKSNLNDNSPVLLLESPAAQYGSPRIALVDTSSWSVSARPAWMVDNSFDRFRIFRQPNLTTPGFAHFLINGSGSVVVGTQVDAYQSKASFEVRRGDADSEYAAWIEWLNAGNHGLGVNVASVTSSKGIANFKSNNVSRLFIRADGNVGIGTSVPESLLDVAGDMKATNGTFTDIASQSASTGALKLSGTNGAIVIDDAGHKRISWNDAGGNFNIRWWNFHNGTSLVYAKSPLDVNGGAAAITLSTDGADGSVGISAAPIGVPGNAVTFPNYFYVTSTNSYFGGGNVGIGTSTPAASLEIKRSVADSNYAAWIEGTNSGNFGLGVNIANTTITKAIADFRSANVSRLHVRADGNVGIGTTTPNATLNVVGWANFSRDNAVECCSSANATISLAENTNSTSKTAAIQFHNSGVSEGYFRLANGGARRFEIGGTQSIPVGLQMTGNLQVDGTGSSYAMGNVGIWTASPGYKLDVAGTANVTGFRMPTGAGAGKVLTSDATGNATWEATGGASSSFESSELPANVGTVSVSHWLAGMPKTWSASLRCKTAEMGYSVGEEVDVTTSGFYNWYHYFTSADSTSVTSMIGGTMYVGNKSTGSISGITPANWRLVLRASR